MQKEHGSAWASHGVAVLEPWSLHSDESLIAKESFMRRRLFDAAVGAMAGGTAATFVHSTAQPAAEATRLAASPTAPAETAASENPAPTPLDAASDNLAAARPFCAWGVPSSENLRVHAGFCSSVNYRTRQPNWVAEHLSANQTDDPAADRKHSSFKADVAVPEPFRATNEDYRNSNLSRGHMAPAGAHRQSQAALNQTFLLSSNIVPQERL